MQHSSSPHQPRASNHLAIGHPLHNVPKEVFSLILRLYMKNFFSEVRNPVSDIPAVLHVCASWREAVINDPRCWTTISVKIDTSLPYVRQNPANRNTKARAIQDTLNTYFSLAGGNLVDITIEFYPDQTAAKRRRARPNLLRWLTKSLPRMRSYNELSFSWEPPFMSSIMGDLRTGQFCDLIHLRLENADEDDDKFSASLPNLQTMSLEYFSSRSVPRFLKNTSTPHLSALQLEWQAFNPASFTALMKHLQNYPNLQELALKYHYFSPFQPKDCNLVQISSVLRLSLSWDPYEHFSFFSVACYTFPSLSSLVLHTDVLRPRSIPHPEDTPCFTTLTSLSLFVRSNHVSDVVPFLGLFPNITYLSLGHNTHSSSGCLSHPSGPNQYQQPALPKILRSIIDALLCNVPSGVINPSPPCPLLKDFTLELAYLNQMTISSLDRFLEQRQNKQLRVSMKKCQYLPNPLSNNLPSPERPLEGNEMDRVELRLLAERAGVYDA